MYRLIFVLGFALFAMFFGAGNLIFPPSLGRLAGAEYVYAMIGFVLTGVGLPLLGVIAVAKAEGGIDHIARRVDPLFAMILSVVIMLAIGPLLAIPRTCATTFELGIAPLMPWMNSWVFSFVYFGVVLFFALNPLAVIDRVGKFLTPLLLTALMLIIVVGVLYPIGDVLPSAIQHPFGKGFVEGYQTMDLMGAVIFGIIILNEVRTKGIIDKRAQLTTIILAGTVAAVGLAVVYGGLVYLGSTTGGVGGEFTRPQLVSFIASSVLGRWGAATLAVAVSMACLTTAIGLTVMCGEYFNKISHGKINYKAICIVVAGMSLVFSNAGVEQIIRLAVPPLVALYPVVMVLVVLCLADRLITNRNIWRGAVVGAFTVGVIEATKSMNIVVPAGEWVYDILPLTNQGLGWLIPAVVLGAVGAFVRGRPKPIYRVLAVSPASQGTRVALYDNETPVLERYIPHPAEMFALSDPAAQRSLIMAEVLQVIHDNTIDRSSIDAVAGRGGFTKPLPSGVYRISERMLEDLDRGVYGSHASNWGAFIAHTVGKQLGVPSFIVDPVVVDEMCALARFTGLPEIHRRSIFHASTHKAVLRKVAKNLWNRPERINVVVAHLGDGVSVAAHERGRAVDVNNAYDGEGPFSAITAGTLPTGDLTRLCYSKRYTESELLSLIRDRGGLIAHLGTGSIAEIERRINEGDDKARAAFEAMAYQVAKAIAECAAVLKGRVDAVALSGRFTASERFVGWIRERVRFIAPVFIYPRENEVLAVAKGMLRALQGDATVQEYY